MYACLSLITIVKWRVVNFAIKKYLVIKKYLATAVEEVVTNISNLL